MAQPQISTIAAVLEHLTGPARGNYVWFTQDTVCLWLTPDGRLKCAHAEGEYDDARCIAQVTRAGSGFEISAGTGEIWVNRHPIDQAPLHHGDTVEFGENGPISRFRVFDERNHPPVSVSGVLGDALSYFRSSRRPLMARLFRVTADVIRRLVLETQAAFRLLVLAALALLTFVVYAQYQTDRRLRAQIESGALQVEAVAAAVAQSRKDALMPGDLADLRYELEQQASDAADRLETLEALTRSGTQVIGKARGSVAFLQGAYGLRHRETGQMLRLVVGEDGVPRNLPNGQPLLSLTGNGPLAEVQFNGTGFVLHDTGLIVTNRHVAVPWDQTPGAGMGGDAMEPVMTRFQAYFPDQPTAVQVETLRISEDADLAVLKADGDLSDGLTLAVEAPMPGAEVFVMGFPTGLRSLLAQSGAGFVEDLERDGMTGFFDVAQRLAEARLISPLSSRGIVAQVTDATIVYDAETTRGGSGGPVLNRAGQVVAVNTAILPEFGGSNLGVPAAKILALLDGF